MKISHGAFLDYIEQLNDEREKKTALVSRAPEASPFFGQLFKSEPDQPDPAQLNKLAELMLATSENESGESKNITAGMTFLGQFIDHDLTLEPMSKIGVAIATTSPLENFRTPRFDLDSLYGQGPTLDSYLYDRHGTFVIGTLDNDHDLPRNSADVAIIIDPRNDENLFLSQLHSAFLKFHNALMANGPDAGNFSATQKWVQRAYQSIILHEYLPAIVHESVLNPLLEQYKNKEMTSRVANNVTPSMPFEFSAAAFRYGHAQIRSTYAVNATREFGLFDIGGFKAVPQSKNLDWNLFFDFGDKKVQFARKIDTNIAAALHNLPDRVSGGDGESLPKRNLVRGQKTFKLPYGEFVAAELGATPIQAGDLPKIKKAELKNIPLWFYVLAEAEQSTFSGQLGPVGGSIVAGTILNLLIRDTDSIAYHPIKPDDLNWSDFSMANLIKTAFDI